MTQNKTYLTSKKQQEFDDNFKKEEMKAKKIYVPSEKQQEFDDNFMEKKEE